MKILLTGATGLIGKEVGKLLAEQGHSLVVLTRNPERAHLELPFPAVIHAWGGHTDPLPKNSIKNVDAVINLAGESIADGRWTPARKKSIADSRIEGTKRIVEAFQADPEAARCLKVFLQGSAIGYYGDQQDQMVYEDSPAGKSFLSGVTRDWEAQADRILDSESTKHVRLAKIRTAVVFSRHGGAMEKFLPIFAHGLGGKLGAGQQWMSWIHLEDIARLFVFCLENPEASGIFNGSAPEPVRNERFTVELARAIGKAVFFPTPESVIRGALGEMASSIFESQRVLPKRALELGFEFNHPEIVLTLQEIAEPLRGGQHEMLSEQWMPQKPEELFPYFCSEMNLETLTPQFLNFRVIGKSTPEMKQGTLIDYRLSLHGVPVKWRSQIEEWQPNKRFVDIQLRGPYKKWRHTHEFLPFAGGTLMRDRVVYKLPLGLLGEVAAGWKVNDQVSSIFSFRRAKISELFGAKI